MNELPHLDGGVVIVGSVYNTGTQQLIVGKGNQVSIYDGNQTIGTITGFSGNVTALAVGDMNGNFRQEILIGTDDFNVHIYQLVQDEWKEIGVKRYFWAPIASILVADITGNGWGDMIVTNARGDAYIYLSWEGKLDIFWRSPPNEPVKYVLSHDLTGNKACEVVLAHQSGSVEVIGWQDEKLRTLWQGYPWGTIESMVIAPLAENDKVQLIVTTDQNMFYSWLWDGITFTPINHFNQNLAGIITEFHPDFGLVALSSKSGITTYSMGYNALQESYSIHLAGITRVIIWNGTLMVNGASGKYYKLQSINPEYIEVYFEEKQIESEIDFILEEGRLYASFEDISKALGWLGFRTKDRIYFVKGLNYLVLDKVKGHITWHNVSLPVDPLISKNGRFYLSLNSLSILGYQAQLDCLNNRLDLTQQWGWW